MPSAAGGVIDRSVIPHSSYYPPFRSLLPQISFHKVLSAFRIPNFCKLPTTSVMYGYKIIVS